MVAERWTAFFAVPAPLAMLAKATCVARSAVPATFVADKSKGKQKIYVATGANKEARINTYHKVEAMMGGQDGVGTGRNLLLADLGATTFTAAPTNLLLTPHTSALVFHLFTEQKFCAGDHQD